MRSESEQRNGGEGGIAEAGSHAGDVVEDRVRRGIEHLVLVEGFEPESFVFDQQSVHRSHFNGRRGCGGMHCYFRVSDEAVKLVSSLCHQGLGKEQQARRRRVRHWRWRPLRPSSCHRSVCARR